MKAIKFTLSGKTAFFKNPEVNTFQYYSYGNIHRVALLGILGSIMGYKGYLENERIEYPEFYKKLNDLKISILPNTSSGNFARKLQRFNNSTGFASLEAGGNLIVKQIWLENVSWDIYIEIDSEISEKLADMIINKKSVYVPYLGTNDHIADIKNCEIVELTEIDSKRVDSLIKSNEVKIQLPRGSFKYEEYLPYKLEKNTERYILENMVFTNGKVESIDSLIYTDNKKNMVFYSGK